MLFGVIMNLASFLILFIIDIIISIIIIFIYVFIIVLIVKPRPRTQTPEWREATKQKSIENKQNPYSGPYAAVAGKE